MKRNIALLFVVIALGFTILLFTYQSITRNIETTIGWNGRTSAMVDSLNQLGFRGKTIQPKQSKNEKIILFVGDSQVEANGLPFHYMMENLVEQLLNEADTTYHYRCYSLGSGGYGQDQQLLALKSYLARYTADEVVLWFTPENDVWNNIFPTHWPVNANPKPTFWLVGDSLCGPNYQWLEVFPQQGKLRLWQWRDLEDLDSKWLSKLPAAYVPTPRAVYKGTISAHPILGGNEAIAIEKSHYTIFLSPPSPRMQYGIQLTRQLLDSMRIYSQQNGARFSMFTALNDEVETMTETPFGVEVDGQVYTLHKQSFFNNIAAITKGFHHQMFHLNTAWKQMSRQDNHHFNHEAQQEIAHKISNELLNKP